MNKLTGIAPQARVGTDEQTLPKSARLKLARVSRALSTGVMNVEFSLSLGYIDGGDGRSLVLATGIMLMVSRILSRRMRVLARVV
jgi:hypothetical protein